MKLFKLFATFILFALTGCATLGGINQAQGAVAQVTIEELATVLIQANCPNPSIPVPAACYAARAAKFSVIVTALDEAATQPGANIAALQATINTQLGTLSPQEQILATPLLSYVLTYLQQQTGAGVFGATQIALVHQISGWLSYACGLYTSPTPAVKLKLS